VAAGGAVGAKLPEAAGQAGSDLRAESPIVKSRADVFFFDDLLFH
jgi:hypothetical protein